MPILIWGGAGLALYFVGKKFGLWGGVTPAPANFSTDPATVTKDLQTASATDPPNYADSQYSQWADTIYQAAGSFSGTSDSATVNSIFDLVWNDADFLKLTQAFGTRRACPWYSMGFDMGCQNVGLGVFITSGFTDSAVAQFNQTLSYNGVTYQF